VPVGALLVGVRDLEDARFVERFAEQLQADSCKLYCGHRKALAVGCTMPNCVFPSPRTRTSA